MAAIILPAHHQSEDDADSQLQVSVHIQATVMAPEAATRKANTWLSMNAGHLLMAENPELILGEPLRWRFDVIRSVPRRDSPGSTRRDFIGHMLVDAVTGETADSGTLIEELTTSANALARHAA